jgi:23S rRNA pseudouridine1911/1915/1917 synthase
LSVCREGPAPATGTCDVVFRDAQICLVDKGPGLLTVPTDAGNPPTVMGLLARRLRGAHDHLFAVHRLDRDTSGLLVVARTRRALAYLVRELAARRVHRTYLGLCQGTPPPCGTLVSHVAASDRDVRVRNVEEGEGKLAVTHFRVVSQAKGVALVAFKLDTGRRNQIRVHLAGLGFPLLGERQYLPAGAASPPGLVDLPRQALHSHRLVLPHPDSGRLVAGLSPLPEDMLAAWRRAGGHHGPVLREGFEIPGPGAPRVEIPASGRG